MRATGRGSAVCAEEVEQKASRASNKNPDDLGQILIWEKKGGCICRGSALARCLANWERP